MVTIVAALFAFTLSDLAMWGATSTIKHFIGNLVLRWLIAIAAIWLVAFLGFGCPQILAWRKKDEKLVPDEDLRMRWALSGFERGGPVGYVSGCLAAGALAMGFYTGQKNDPRAYQKTAAASLVFAAFWGPWYVQLGRTGLVLVFVFFGLFLLTGALGSKGKGS